MARLKDYKVKVEGIETIKGVLEAVEQKKEIEILYQVMTNDLNDCRSLTSPYSRRYGMDRGSLLSGLLETYHQLRLKDA